jgi:cobalt-zinc-cadmium efflux system membrane fusion protein
MRGLSLALIGILALHVGCQGHAHAPAADAAAEAKPDAGDAGDLQKKRGLKLDDAMLQNVTVEEALSESVPALLTATGKVQFDEDRMARILAPVSGQVVKLPLRVGDRVAQGQTLFYIHSREAAAAIAEHVESHKDLDLAEKTQAMTRDLFEHQAASRMSLQQAESDLVKARGRVARTEETLRVLGVDLEEGGARLDPRVPVRAPLAGTVVERRVTEGQFVQPDPNPLLVIADLSSVWVLGDVYERDLRLVRVGQKAEVRAAAYPDERFTARVERISDTIDPGTRAVKVRFLVANPSFRLKPEMFAAMTLVLSESRTVVTVPVKAVFSEAERTYVFVLASPHHFQRRQVEVAPDLSGRACIVSGLKAGERVVADGALLLRLQQAKKES